MIERIIKIVLAILLLFCLAPMPYGYYELVRFVAMAVFGILGYRAIALLFQPFFKVALGREIWQVVDVLLSLGLKESLKIKQPK